MISLGISDPVSGICSCERFTYRSRYVTFSTPSVPTHVVSHTVGLHRTFQSINARCRHCRHSASQICRSYCHNLRWLPIVAGVLSRVDCEKGATYMTSPLPSGRRTPSLGAQELAFGFCRNANWSVFEILSTGNSNGCMECTRRSIQ